MRLFLVRHGESVDNVAGLYAGSRDSTLTSHGVLQTRRLGSHLVATPSSSGPDSIVITNLFSSDLQRAFLTASAILDAQQRKGVEETRVATEVVKLVGIRERDFRSGEGVRIAGGSRDAFADAESREEMQVRVTRFIDDHLHPLFIEEGDVDGRAIVVVSHGIILNVILTALLQRYAPSELSRLLPPDLPGGSKLRGPPKLHISWSNTGYIDISVSVVRDKKDMDGGDQHDENEGSEYGPASVRMRVLAVNCIDHLAGLKKTRGGIGSAKFDAKQKTMDAFFAPAAKRQKRQED
ncbi:phosphoglycerate mutase [Ophiostoma piceae UAMH 11346]|uniref:Phosphoglycerate mutase n=1 Tax=Ophiostoma piceae (strain UAMH 11346) TaxID=1262450 RepID=S3D4F0_OPHP1|nr:phosphoglycerate mutase [Ophiostoma piceae UAMH 11346]